ncbi:hypothetical protein PoB_007306400 [Plakobranchus ocellatus]|uniref:Uncharacterized protein n=1 Tax=Plakobranchus ocellatus TaxID=259542 RepID=A0AAV4DRB5_9GAST|nr:hypothetical protein PoB_007306400 [Plakobranchus ocellatus]
MFGCEARMGLTTSSLPVEVIAWKETEEDLLAVTPIRPDSDNNSLSFSQTDGLQTGSKLQVMKHQQRLYRVLLPVEHSSTSAQDTGDNVTSQPMKAGIFGMPTGPSSPTPTPSAYDVESPFSSGESEEHMGPLAPSPSEGHVFSAEIHRVA